MPSTEKSRRLMSSAVLERPAEEAGRGGTGRLHRLRTGWDGPRIVVVVTAALAGIAALVLSSTIFSHLSVNNDETVYLLQAKTYADGRLFPPAGDPASSFTPWLGVIRGDHYVLKYTPVVPGILALSLVLTGGYAAALAAWAMALVGATFLLAKEVTGNRATAALAAVLTTITPLTLVQGALALPYVPFAVLAELALWALLVGARRRHTRLLALAGFVGGLAFMARAFDALLILLPTLLWVLWRSRQRWRLLGGMAAGAVPPAAFLLWFDYVSTGSPLRQPFSLFNPDDTLGFGVHRLFPGERPKHFGLAQGWEGLWAHLRLLGQGWAAGALVLLVLVVLALVRRQVSAAAVSVLAGGLVTTFGYLFFWGIWNAAIIWGATRYIGPYYLMPLIAPACIVAAVAISGVVAALRDRGPAPRPRWQRPLAAATAALTLAGLGFSTATFVSAVDVNGDLNAANRELAGAVDARGRSLMFVDTSPAFLQHPTAVISNEPMLDGRTLFALNKGGADFAVMDNYRGRAVWSLRLLGEYGKRPHSGYGARLQELTLASAASIGLDVRVRLPKSTAEAYLQLTVGGRTQQIGLSAGTGSGPIVPVRIPVTLTRGQGTGPETGLAMSGVDLTGLDQATVTLLTRRTGAITWSSSRLTVPMRNAGGGELQVLVPTGPVTALGPAPDPTLSYQLASAAG